MHGEYDGCTYTAGVSWPVAVYTASAVASEGPLSCLLLQDMLQ